MKNNNPKGIILILFGMFVFSIQDSIMKYIYNFVSLYEIYLVRTLVSLVIILIFLKITKKPIIFKTQYPLLTFCRISLFFFGFSSFYISLTVLPLITATALFFVTPFLITIFAKFFLKEQIGPRRWSAVIIGFIGSLMLILFLGLIAFIGLKISLRCRNNYSKLIAIGCTLLLVGQAWEL